MKLYQSVGPNPRVATMYIAERGLPISRVFMDIQGGENRTPEMMAKNPSGGSPFLEKDDGSILSDSVAICTYLEGLHGATDLVGTNADDVGATWSALRTVDQNVVVPMANGFRSAEGLPMFQSRMFCCPEASDGNKAYARDGLTQIDKHLAGKDYLCGSRFSLADILLFCFVEFGALVGQPVPEGLSNIKAWQARVGARPSAATSADPKNGL
jgi:glutathione S-transferase